MQTRFPGVGDQLRLAGVSEPDWITGTEAAKILEISKTRVWQLALKDLLPWEFADNGRRKYRRSQIEVISRARQIRWHPIDD